MTQAATRLMLASKKSRPMWTRSEVVAADDLLHQALQLVGEDDDVVAVPAHAAADVQQHLVEEQQAPRRSCRRSSRWGGSARCPGTAACRGWHRVAQVELVRADDVALRADAEQLALHRVQVVAPGRSPRRRSRPANRVRQLTRASCGRRACPCSRRGSRRWSRRACPAPGPIAAPILRQAMPCSIQNCACPRRRWRA